LIDELRARQTGDGSFRYWAGGVESFDFVSVYALHVLLEAAERGDAVPTDLMTAGKGYLTQLARRDGNSLSDERTSAYAIYLLARQGVVVSNEAAGLQRRLATRYEKVWREDIVAAYLAAAYKLMKQDALANQSIARVSFGAHADVDRWHEPMATDSMLLYLLSRHFPERLNRLPDDVLDTLVARVKNGEYDSLSAATTILALDAYASATAAPGSVRLAIQATLVDKSTQALPLPAGLFPSVEFPADTRSLDFSSDAEVRSFYLVTDSGFDLKPTTQTMSQGLEIVREYLTSEGKPADKIKVGDEITVHLKFRAIDRERIDDAVLVDLLPGGFDLVIPSAPPAEQQGGPGRSAGCICLFLLTRPAGFPDFADLREDRVVLYGQATNQVEEFSYKIKATNAGKFAVPSAFGESMYDPKVRARSAAGQLVVESP
jgi:hypothetical protein